MRAFLISFFLVNLLLSSFFLDVSMSPNPTSRALPVLVLFEEGTFRIDAYRRLTSDESIINGHYYSDKAPLSSLIVAPFYGLLKIASLAIAPYGRPETGGLVAIVVLGDVLCGSIPFALAMTLSLYALFRRGKQNFRYRSVLIVIFSWYGSFLFVWSGVYFGHLLAGLFLLLSYIYLVDHRDFFLCGVLLGLSVSVLGT
jgi:hypothetical protein